MRARRLPIVDEYVEGDEAVVMVDDQVLTLSPVASAALATVGPQWTDATVVADVLVDRFGAPPGAADVVATVRDLLRSLAGLGLLEIDSE